MEKIELTLMAHRKILTALLAVAARDDACWERLMDHLRDDLVVQDHEEDPGVVPSPDFAYQNALSKELMDIVSRAEIRATDGAESEIKKPSPLL
ncbi:hypothetical protein MZK49_22600 [Ensifer sesbaniae]|uniref:hypothetical protein n=1 Tax=Ensifer sesbaniae TaxID=1214071 RepID=UPI002000636A|nr:hypothetical protein [Ensifer sesbaniae]